MEPRYNEDLGTMKITLLYQVSHYIRVKIQRNIKRWDQQNYLVIRGFCYMYIWPLYNEVPLYLHNQYSSLIQCGLRLCNWYLHVIGNFTFKWDSKFLIKFLLLSSDPVLITFNVLHFLIGVYMYTQEGRVYNLFIQ